MSVSPILNATLSSNTSTSTVSINQAGYYAYSAVGTFGSGTLKPYVIPNGQSTGVEIARFNFTASNADALIWLVPGDKFYATLSGATSPSIKVVLDQAV